jgi:hypothetical protein
MGALSFCVHNLKSRMSVVFRSPLLETVSGNHSVSVYVERSTVPAGGSCQCQQPRSIRREEIARLRRLPAQENTTTCQPQSKGPYISAFIWLLMVKSQKLET